MLCPKCGYLMDAFDIECPRCKQLEANANKAATKEATQSDIPVSLADNARQTPPPRHGLSAAVLGAVSGALLISCIAISLVISRLPHESPPEPTPTQTPTAVPMVPPAETMPAHSPAVNQTPPVQRTETVKDATKTPQQIAKDCFPSIVTLGADDYNNDLVQGSGFFVEDGLIATNKHVVGEASMVLAWITGHKSNDYLKAKHVIVGNDRKDIALLEVPHGFAKPLPMADLNKIEIGDTIYTLGSPKGLEGTIAAGMISNIRRNDDGTISAIQISAPISHGSSGGPVVNTRGEVIGLSAVSVVDGQNLNFAVPITDVRPLIDMYHSQNY